MAFVGLNAGRICVGLPDFVFDLFNVDVECRYWAPTEVMGKYGNDSDVGVCRSILTDN